jgi:AcrR family transcriptional regulator
MIPAPPRGCYDRQLSHAQRQAEHRDRLLQATAAAVERAVASEQPSVGAIVAAAGTGRNTFYAHFRDVGAAEQAVLARLIGELNERVERHVIETHVPLEALRDLLVPWTDAIDTWRALAPAAFRISTRERRGGLSRIATQLRQHLRRATAAARREGALSTPADELRLMAVAAAGEALLGWYVDHPGSRYDVIALGGELVVRAFR